MKLHEKDGGNSLDDVLCVYPEGNNQSLSGAAYACLCLAGGGRHPRAS